LADSERSEVKVGGAPSATVRFFSKTTTSSEAVEEGVADGVTEGGAPCIGARLDPIRSSAKRPLTAATILGESRCWGVRLSRW